MKMESLQSYSLKKIVEKLSESDKDEIESLLFPKDLWLVTVQTKGFPEKKFIIRTSEIGIQNFWKTQLFKTIIIETGFSFTYSYHGTYICKICDDGGIFSLTGLTPCEHFGIELKNISEESWKNIFEKCSSHFSATPKMKFEKLPEQYLALF